MNQRYTNREIDDKFGTVCEKLDEIHIQVKNTNGRLRGLEKWQAGIKGGLAVLTAIVAPIFLYMLYSLLK